jgi:uncharacterized membrane protein
LFKILKRKVWKTLQERVTKKTFAKILIIYITFWILKFYEKYYRRKSGENCNKKIAKNSLEFINIGSFQKSITAINYKKFPSKISP